MVYLRVEQRRLGKRDSEVTEKQESGAIEAKRKMSEE